MTEDMNKKPRVMRESKNKIRVDFERTSLKERLKEKYLSMYFFKRAVWYLFRLLLLIGIAFVVLKPFYTMITKSFTAAVDFVDPTVVNVPRHFSAIIYKAIIVDLKYVRVFFETMGLSLACALLQTFSCCLIGYGISKFKFRGNKIVFFAVILTLAIPHGTMQSAIYYRFQHLDVLGILTFGRCTYRHRMAGRHPFQDQTVAVPERRSDHSDRHSAVASFGNRSGAQERALHLHDASVLPRCAG